MPNFDAPADLYRVEMLAPKTHKLRAAHSPLRSAKFSECVRMVMADHACHRAAYYIVVPLEAGFGKTKLMYPDIEVISQRADFPLSLDRFATPHPTSGAIRLSDGSERAMQQENPF